jgi:hypothetical protein
VESVIHLLKGAVAQGRKPVQQPFLYTSRRKNVENKRQTSKMLKTQSAKIDPSDF